MKDYLLLAAAVFMAGVGVVVTFLGFEISSEKLNKISGTGDEKPELERKAS